MAKDEKGHLNVEDFVDLSDIGKFSLELERKIPNSVIEHNKSKHIVVLTSRALFTILFIRRTIDYQLYVTILRYVSVLYSFVSINPSRKKKADK